MIEMDVVFFGAALVIYLLAAILYLVSLLMRSDKVGHWATLALVAAAGVHSAAIVFRWTESGHAPVSNLFEGLSLYTWLMVVFYLAMERVYKQRILGAFVTPLAFIAILVASILPKEIKPLVPALQYHLFAVHASIALLSYAAFTLAFCASIIYLLQARALKNKKQNALLFRLPPLQTMERLSYIMVGIGFPLITVAIVMGAFVAKAAWGSYWSWEQKEIWALVTWLVFGAALNFRVIGNWRGRKSAWLIVFGFVSILITFFGVNIVAPGPHNYMF